MQSQCLEHGIGPTVGKEGVDIGGPRTTSTEHGRDRSRRTECAVQGIRRIGTEWLCPILIPVFIYTYMYMCQESVRKLKKSQEEKRNTNTIDHTYHHLYFLHHHQTDRHDIPTKHNHDT